MAAVPTLDNFTVRPAGGSGARVEAPPARSAAGEQLQEAGRAIQGAGSTAADIFRDAQALANQTRVDDAINQAREAVNRLTYDKDEGYTNLQGLDAFKRPNGQGLDEEYGARLGSSLDSISKELGNDVQRRAFAAAAGQIRTTFSGNLQKHESDQFRGYSLSVKEGTIALSQDDIGRNYADSAIVERNILSIRAAVAEEARLLGKSATWAEAQTKNVISSAHKTALASALQNNDLTFVQGYLNEHADEMEAGDVLDVNGALTKQQNFTYATQAADNVDAGVAVGGGRPENLTMPVKGVVTSGYGQRKPFQTDNGKMSSASHDGIDIAAPDGAKVGAAASGTVVFAGKKGGYGNYVEVRHADGTTTFYGHMSSLSVKVGDNVAQGAQLGAVGSTGNSTGPHLHWGMRNAAGQSVNPQSVRTVGGAPGIGDGASLIEKITALGNDPWLAAHPEAREMAEQRLRSLHAAREQSQEDSEQEAAASIERELIGQYMRGQTPKLTPQMMAQVPDKYVTRVWGVQNALEDNARSRASASGQRGSATTWASLKGQIASGQINNLDQLTPHIGVLSDSQYQDLANTVISVQNRDAKMIDSMGTLDKTLKFVHAEMLAAGVDWTPDSKDPEAAERFGQFQSSLLQQLTAQERAKGRALTVQEGREIALTLLAESAGARSGWFGTKRGFQLDAGQQEIAIQLQRKGIEISQPNIKAARALIQNGHTVTREHIQYALKYPHVDLATIRWRPK